MKILIIDDEPSIVAGLSAMLELHDFDPEGATDSDAAQLRVAEEFFPLILADLRMRTEEEGLRLLDAVRRLSPRSRVASMTGYADAATEALLRSHGAHCVLRKPLLAEDVIGVLREMLALVEAPAQENASDGELYAATIRSLRATAGRRYGLDQDDVDDLVQEAWLLFLEKRVNVRTPGAWLSGAMTNLCRQRIGDRVRVRARSADLVDDFAAPSAGDAAMVLHQGLSLVDDRTRALCTRIGLEQQSYEEVSAALGIPLGSVGPLYMRAKKRLRTALSN